MLNHVGSKIPPLPSYLQLINLLYFYFHKGALNIMTYADTTQLESMLKRWDNELDSDLYTEAIEESDNIIDLQLRLKLPDYTPTAPYDALLVQAANFIAGYCALDIIFSDETQRSTTAIEWEKRGLDFLYGFIEEYENSTTYEETKTRIGIFSIIGPDSEEYEADEEDE